MHPRVSSLETGIYLETTQRIRAFPLCLDFISVCFLRRFQVALGDAPDCRLKSRQGLRLLLVGHDVPVASTIFHVILPIFVIFQSHFWSRVRHSVTQESPNVRLPSTSSRSFAYHLCFPSETHTY